MTQPFKLPLSALLLAIAGCGDAIFYNRQFVTLHITDMRTGADIPNAEIRAVSPSARMYYANLSDDRLWDRSGDPPSFTDESGKTDHAFRFISTCGGPVPLVWLFCDKVSGDITNSEQYIRIKTDMAADAFKIRVLPHQPIAGAVYYVTIEQIGKTELDPDRP